MIHRLAASSVATLALASAVPAQTSAYALRFYGTGVNQEDRVRIAVDDDVPGPDASEPCDVGAGSFTLEFWVRGTVADNPSGNFGGDQEVFSNAWIDAHIVLDRDIWGGSNRSFGVSFAGGLVRFGVDGGDNNNESAVTIEGDANALDGAWHHVACVRDASNGQTRIFIDGQLDFASTPGVSFADLSYPNEGVPNQNTVWGRYLVIAAEKHDAGPNYPSYAGFFDELRIWDVARTQAEIAGSMAFVLPNDVPGLVASYRLEEGAGTQVADTSVAGSPDGQLIAGLPGNGEWVSWANDPQNTAPVSPWNLPPVVVATGSPLTGPAPLAVQFSSAGTFDPDNGPAPLTYDWDFGDGGSSTEEHPLHPYAQDGVYSAVLEVSDGADLVQSDPIEVVVGNAPVATILEPTRGTLFRGGDLVSFSGSAVDIEDGPLPPSALTWTVVRVTSGSTFPFAGPFAGVAQGDFTIPTTGFPPIDTHFEVELVAVDSSNLPGRATRVLDPALAPVAFDSNPSGATIEVNGEPVATPGSLDLLVGFQHAIEAPVMFDVANTSHLFCTYDVGARRVMLWTVPDGGGSIVARYVTAATGVLEIGVPAPERNADWYGPIGQAFSNLYDALGLCTGRDSGGVFQMGLEFPLALPSRAVILSAEIEMVPTNDQSGAPTATISAYDVADAPPFVLGSPVALTSHAPLTVSQIDWTLPPFTPGVPVTTPDLTALVREVLQRPDWTAGGFVGFVLDGTPSPSGSWRCVRNQQSGNGPILRIGYAIPAALCDGPALPR